jgi:drug/metabolite transporter (DMT)-like permease
VGLFAICSNTIELLGAHAGVSAYQVVWSRYGFHLAFMLLVFGPRYGTALARSPRLGLQIGRSLLMLGMPLCFVWAASRISAHDAFAIFWVAPLMLPFLEQGKDALHLSSLVPVGIGWVGAMLISHPSRDLFRSGTVFALGMAACFAWYVVLTWRMRREPIMPKLFHTALWVFVSLSFVVPLIWRPPSGRGLLALIAVGLVGWVALYALDRAVEETPPSLVAPFFYLQLPLGMLLELQGHMPPLGVLAGTGLIAVAAGMALARSGGMSRPAPEAS